MNMIRPLIFLFSPSFSWIFFLPDSPSLPLSLHYTSVSSWGFLCIPFCLWIHSSLSLAILIERMRKEKKETRKSNRKTNLCSTLFASFLPSLLSRLIKSLSQLKQETRQVLVWLKRCRKLVALQCPGWKQVSISGRQRIMKHDRSKRKKGNILTIIEMTVTVISFRESSHFLFLDVLFFPSFLCLYVCFASFFTRVSLFFSFVLLLFPSHSSFLVLWFF